MAKHNIIGEIGENIATKWLLDDGFVIIDRNYRRKWGEIDVIAHKNNKIYFIEVKTVSHETLQQLKNAVSHETWRPEENVTKHKLKKLGNIIETWLAQNNGDREWQLDVLTVRMVSCEKYARVECIENVILEK